MLYLSSPPCQHTAVRRESCIPELSALMSIINIALQHASAFSCQQEYQFVNSGPSYGHPGCVTRQNPFMGPKDCRNGAH